MRIQPIHSVVNVSGYSIMTQYSPKGQINNGDAFEQALREAEDVIETNNIPASLGIANMQKLHELILARRKDWRQ